MAIVGKSGCGKTTFLKAIQSITAPFRETKTSFSGDVLMRNRSIFPRKSLLGLPQNPEFQEALSDLRSSVFFLDEAFATGNKNDAPLAERAVKLKKDEELSSVFVTHNLPAMAEAVDRIYHMHDGRFVWQGSIEDMRKDASDLPEPTQEYLTFVKRIFDWEP